MKTKIPTDSNQLSLFIDENSSAGLRKIDDLEHEISRHVTANDPHAAKAAARKQEALLKKMIQEKKDKKEQR